MKQSNPRKWFQWLKRLVSSNQTKEQEIVVEEIDHLSKEVQAEMIAESFASISQEYKELETKDINFPPFSKEDIPIISVKTVENCLNEIQVNKATNKNDIPAVLFKKFSKFLCEPIANLINACLQQGQCPDVFKCEVVTPVPKVFPPTKIDDLRNISGLLTINKVAEKCIAPIMIADMKKKLDPTQYANQKGISMQHYLINMLNRILTSLDNSSKGEAKAVIATLVDWKQAFPRQCPKLGIEAFIAVGIRPSLIPMLVNYFQNRNMTVKWKGIYSRIRKLNGGGPQGGTFGILEYLSQSNDNANNVNESDRFKFVDDLTILEIINLLTIEISSYDFYSHVPSDIPTHNNDIRRKHENAQENLNLINVWEKKE